MRGFTKKDGLALLRLLATLSGMTVVIWLAIQLLPPFGLSVSDVYVLSCVLLLAAHLFRRNARKLRNPDPDD